MLERLRAVVRSAEDGLAGCVAVVGEPGIGKSTLLDAAAAVSRTFDVVRLQGTPAESSIALASLEPLLRRYAASVSSLNDRQRSAITGGSSDQLALGTAVIHLLDRAAVERPVVVVADDLQWFDEASRWALLFAARRLGGERVALLLASRDEHAFDDSGIETLHLTGMDAQECHALLDALGLAVDPTVADALRSLTGGNPLALRAVVQDLTPAQRRGATPLPSWVALPERILRAFTTRVEAIPSPAAELLLLVSLGGGESAVLSASAGLLGLDLAELAAAEDAGLARTTPHGVDVSHPLVAQAVVAWAGGARVRAAEGVLAMAFAEYDADRTAWHSANATLGVDDAVADALVRSADRAAARGATGTAARAYERAARLSSSAGARTERLARAARAALAAGSTTQARHLADEVLERDPKASRAHVVVGLVERLRGRPGLAVERFVQAASTSPPDVAVTLLVQAAEVASEAGGGRMAGPVVEALRPFLDRVHADAGLRLRYDVVNAEVLAFAGAEAAAGDLEADVLVRGAAIPADELEPAGFLAVAVAASHAGRFAESTRAAGAAADAARQRGDADLLVTALDMGAFAQVVGGSWSAAYALAEEGLAFVTVESAPFLRANLLLRVAEIDAAHGSEAACRNHCAQARSIGAALDLIEIEVLADRWEALLDLGHGNAAAVVARLLRLQPRIAGTVADHSYHSPVPDLVEAYVRLGDLDAARALVPSFERLTPPGCFRPAWARRLKVQGLVAPIGAYEALLAEAADLDLQMGMDFHAARDLLVLGERLRRDRANVQARGPLGEALRIFVERQARPWADRARSELAATGDRSNTEEAPQTPLTEVLTPQELQIAMLVGQGMRNVDIAGSLFLSTRTVEFHLTRIYRKLGLRGRASLASRLAEPRSAGV